MFRGHRDRSRPDSRQTKARRSRNYRFDLEGLESRTLLATIPGRGGDELSACQPVDNRWAMVPGAQEDSPVVAVDPLDPQKIVAVWVNNDTADIPAPRPQVFVEGEYSVNGGQTWASFYSQCGFA